MPEHEITATINFNVSKEYQELQETLLQAGQLIVKAAALLEKVKETAFKKIDFD